MNIFNSIYNNLPTWSTVPENDIREEVANELSQTDRIEEVMQQPVEELYKGDPLLEVSQEIVEPEVVIEPPVVEVKKAPVKASKPALPSNPGLLGLQSEVLKSGFPLMGGTISTALGTAHIQETLENKKNASVDLIKHGEKNLHTLPLLKNVKLIEKSDSFFTKGIKAIVNLVGSIFHKIGVFFGLCKAENQLSMDKKTERNAHEKRQDTLKTAYDLYTKREILRVQINSLQMKLDISPAEHNRIALMENQANTLTLAMHKFGKSDAYIDLNLKMLEITGEATYSLGKEFHKSSLNIRRQAHDSAVSLNLKRYESLYADAFYLFKDQLTKAYRKEIHELDKKAKVEVLNREFAFESAALLEKYNKDVIEALDSHADPLNNPLEDVNKLHATYVLQVQELEKCKAETVAAINNQTDTEHTNDLVRDYVDGALHNIPVVKMVASLFPSVINQASHIVSSALISESLGFLREYVFGSDVKAVLDVVQEKVVQDVTENFKVINKDYYENRRKNNESVESYNHSIQARVLESLRDRETQEVNSGWKKDLLNQAIPVLSANEIQLLFEKNELVQKSTAKTQKAIDEKFKYLEQEKQKLYRECEVKRDAITTLILGDQANIDHDLLMKGDALSKSELSEKDQFVEYKKLMSSYDLDVDKLERLNAARYNEIRNLGKNVELAVQELTDKTDVEILQLQNSLTMDCSIQALEKNILTLNAKKTTATLLDKTRLETTIKSEQLLLGQLKSLIVVEKKIADGEALFLESMANLIQDQILFPNGMPLRLRGLLKVASQSDFFKNLIKKQLSAVMNLLDKPEALKKMISELPRVDQGEESLVQNINTMLAKILGDYSYITRSLFVNTDAGVELIVDRMDASRVNKYLFFSALCSAVDGTVTSIGRRVELSDGKVLIKG